MEVTKSINLLPREKALQFGIESLNDKELLSILIGYGGKDNSVFEIADSLLRTYGSLGLLASVNFSDLSSQKGLKDGKSLLLLTAFEIHRRLNTPEYKENEVLDSTSKIYQRYKHLEDYNQEILYLVMLNKRKKVLKEKILYQGTCDGFNINLKEIMSEILIAKCSYFVLIHNHVDEEDGPSIEDIISTRIIKNSSEDLGIHLIDHLIIKKNECHSMKEAGEI